MKNYTSRFSGKIFVVDDYDEDLGVVKFHTTYIKRVMYNDPATIVFWSDGTKTVTKCSGGDVYSKETGLAICILKKYMGVNEVFELFCDWLPEEDEPNVGTTITLRDVRKRYKMIEKYLDEYPDEF